jgi:AraC-like DNA-binding protein
VTDNRPLSSRERDAKHAAVIFEMSAQGYSNSEIARELGLSYQQVTRIAKRTAARTPAEDAKHWRKLQLLEYERLKRAVEAVLEAHHVVVSNGHVVHQYAVDEEGKPIWDPVWGPDGKQLVDDQGNLRVEQRRIPLRDNGVVMEAVAELRKINTQISKLLGLDMPVKQTVEVQQVNYTIAGVDMSKVTGANRK